MTYFLNAVDVPVLFARQNEVFYTAASSSESLWCHSASTGNRQPANHLDKIKNNGMINTCKHVLGTVCNSNRSSKQYTHVLLILTKKTSS